MRGSHSPVACHGANCAFARKRSTARRSRASLVPQLEALDLSGRGFRQAVDDLDPARIFPRADLLLDVLLQRLVQAVGLRARAQHHEGLRLQQPFRIGFRHHGGLQHRGMGDQRALDLERRHPDAGHLEHVVAAAAEGVAAVGVANVFVAGAGPVALEGLSGSCCAGSSSLRRPTAHRTSSSPTSPSATSLPASLTSRTS